MDSFILQQSDRVDVCGHCNKNALINAPYARPYNVTCVTVGFMLLVKA